MYCSWVIQVSVPPNRLFGNVCWEPQPATSRCLTVLCGILVDTGIKLVFTVSMPLYHIWVRQNSYDNQYSFIFPGENHGGYVPVFCSLIHLAEPIGS